MTATLAVASPSIAVETKPPPLWIDPGMKGEFPASASYENTYGELGVVNAEGPVSMKDHPFFTPLGSNGRACVSCHQPAYAMSVSVGGLKERWRASSGKDPVFAAIDGSNCPHLPQADEGSHSLLLERGLFRISLPWPPKDANGKPLKPEFTLEVVRDPTGCNTHYQYGLRAKQPMVSVYRRPRPVANLKYLTASAGSGLFNAKTGLPTSVDPETGLPAAMNLLSDARHPTLKAQALDAGRVHLQMPAPFSSRQLEQLVNFELHVYSAQRKDRIGGELAGGSAALTPEALWHGKAGIFGDTFRTPVFGSFDAWRDAGKSGTAQDDATQRAFRASVARGNDVFFTRSFWVRDAMPMNAAGSGNPSKQTCVSCHVMQMTGTDATAGWTDIGTTNMPWANESPELPLFKITCDKELPPHAFLGRTIYTQDPGRALISGKCGDVGAIVVQQFRGLAARAPYFANGSAKNLRELVDFYDRRFNVRFTEQEKQDLVNFLSVL